MISPIVLMIAPIKRLTIGVIIFKSVKSVVNFNLP
jgi:hypothetical protein